MADRSLASERNPFPQDIERLSFTSPRRSWVSKNLSSLVYTAISLIVFAYYYFTFYPVLGNGFNDSNSTSTTVMFQNPTLKPVTVPASTSTVSPSVQYESSIPNANWTTANKVPWITTVLTTIPTTAATAEPTSMPTTVPTSVSTSGLVTTVTSSTLLEVKNLTITVVTTSETAVEPRRFGHRDENSYVAEDDEYDRPQFMGKAPWDWCVPRWQPLDEFVDKQWMCNRCHADALAGIYKIEEYYIRDYEYWCSRMCFINSILEECAVHLNRTQPRPSPDAARDCRFCEEQERHRKPSRLFV